MIQLYVSDLDGTLLGRLHRSDAIVSRAIDTVLKHDKQFAIATGRHLHKNHRVGLDFLDKPIYLICMNGALIYTPERKVLKSTPIRSSVINEMMNMFPQVSFEFVTADGVSVLRDRWAHFCSITKKSRSPRHIIKHLIAAVFGDYHYEAVGFAKDAVLKVDCRIEDVEIRKKFRTFLKENEHELKDAGYKEDIFEITAASVNKRDAVLALMTHLKYNEDEVAVYGNDRNDVEMLSYFANAYAPNNSTQAVLEVVPHIIGSSYERSVAQHIIRTVEEQI